MAAEKGMDRKKTDGATEVSNRGPRLPWPVLAVNFALMTLILVAGFLYTRRQIEQIKIEKKNELRAIAELKTGQVRRWLDEILEDGRFLQSSINFNAVFMEKLKIKPADFQKILSTWIKAFKASRKSASWTCKPGPFGRRPEKANQPIRHWPGNCKPLLPPAKFPFPICIFPGL
jgi:hypothetical protein